MKPRSQDQQEYLLALHAAARCPRCGQGFAGGLCPNPDCAPAPSDDGPLSRRMSGLDWTPRVATTLPAQRPSAPWEVALPSFIAEPPPKPDRSGVVLAVAIVLILVLVAGAAAYVTLRPNLGAKATAPAASAQPTFPASWDPRVQPLVDFVQKDRGLSFDHPVSVNFVTPAGYSAAVSSGSLGAAAQASAHSEEGLYRALGLVSGSFDLNASSNQLQDDGTLAFYSDQAKDITVRGTDLTVGVRVTLAHELTHVLQDQHFDLTRINQMPDSGQQFAYQALFEGDAVRVENDYVASLAPADQQAYDAEQNAQGSSASTGLAGVPTALVTMFGAPYVLGPELVKVLMARGGNSAVDEALRNPPLDELQVFDPYVYFAKTLPQKVAEPALGKVEKRFDGGDFGAMSWYIVLTQRIDPHLALPASDAWGGDAYVAYTKGTKSCARADISAATPSGVSALTTAFAAWAQAMPAGSASVTAKAGGIEVNACDPGTGANLQPVPTAQEALVLPVFRTDFVQGALASGAPLPISRCSATAVVLAHSEADMADPTGAAFTSAAGRAQLSQAVASCRTVSG